MNDLWANSTITTTVPDCTEPYHYEPMVFAGGILALLIICVFLLIWKFCD